jgi:hypothetical protein
MIRSAVADPCIDPGNGHEAVAAPYAGSMGTGRLVFDGHILGASFASGDRLVAGRWHDAPFGPFADVMWCHPDGRRTLLAPTEAVADFITRHYPFDEVRIGGVRVERHGRAVSVDAGPIAMRLTPRRRGLASHLLRLRPRARCARSEGGSRSRTRSCGPPPVPSSARTRGRSGPGA